MNAILIFALRYLFGGSKRGVAIIMGVALCLIPLIVMQQVATNMLKGILDRFIQLGTSHIKIASHNTADYDEMIALAEKIRNIDGVSSAEPEIEGTGILTNVNGQARNVQIRGLNQSFFENDDSVRKYLNITSGKFELLPQDNKYPIVIGANTAKEANLNTGDMVNLVTFTSLGLGGYLPRLTPLKVSATFDAGYRDLDNYWVFVSLDKAVRIIPIENATYTINVKIENPYALPNPLFYNGLESLGAQNEINKARSVLSQIYPLMGTNWYAMSWFSAQRSLFSSYIATLSMLYFVMVVVLLVAIVNIINALTSLALDKEFDIAVLKSSGVSSKDISLIFVTIALISSAIGSFIAVTIGLLISININKVFTAMTLLGGSGLNSDYYLPFIPTQVSLGSVLLSVFMCLSFACLSSVIPAYKASKKDPSILLTKKGR